MPPNCLRTPAPQPSDPFADYRSGSTEPWVVDILCALVGATKPKNLLETGTFLGKTTEALWWAAPPNSLLTSLEVDEARWTDVHAKLDAKLAPAVSFLNVDAIEYLSSYDGPQFNFVFLDDDHERQHVAAELDLLHDRKLVAPGGLICVHDVVGPFGLGAVVAARHGFILELPRLHAAGSLGIIQVPS